jgi:hypothetical protein
MSLANCVLLATDQLLAPDWTGEGMSVGYYEKGGEIRALTTQAFFRGTIWSMSMSEAAVHVAPSKAETHVPEVAVQAEFVTTFVPSLFRTYSL